MPESDELVPYDFPTYRVLMLPVLAAVQRLGGSGTGREIVTNLVEAEEFSDDLLDVSYEGRNKSVLVDRIEWARSYCKLGGVLESPKRGLYLITDLGQEVLALPADEATERLLEIDRGVRRSRRRASAKKAAVDEEAADDVSPDTEESNTWAEELLGRLHRLSPEAFEHFVMFLLRAKGMELERVGGSGDEGIDGIGRAPITSVLSTTVAVQAKRYEPSKTVGRETVALFQSDATAAGAEHGVLITTAKFSAPARKAASGRHPTIDLIDGERLAELCLEEEIGISLRPRVNESFFDRFEDL